MTFSLDEAVALLARTPATVDALLRGLPEQWVRADEGPGTWSPFDVVGHLVHGEKTDWIPRVRIILEHGDGEPFESFDRRGHEAWWGGWSLADLLDELVRRRAENLRELERLDLGDEQLARPGMHPELGPVTLRQLLAAWVVHDLHHVGQITRAMARRYDGDVGAWRPYLTVLTR